MTLLFLSLGLGCLWHGLQIVWVAPRPSQLTRNRERPAGEELDAAQTFQQFWLDQYGWIGITMSVLGVVLCLLGLS